MGVDTRLYINPKWEVKDIKEVIEKRFKTTAKVNFHDFAPDYMTIQFKIPDGQYERLLHVHTKTEVGGLPAILLDFRSNEEGIAILKKLAETFGGLFNEADTDDIFESYDPPAKSEAEFLLDEAIKEDPENGRNIEKLINFLRKENE